MEGKVAFGRPQSKFEARRSIKFYASTLEKWNSIREKFDKTHDDFALYLLNYYEEQQNQVNQVADATIVADIDNKIETKLDPVSLIRLQQKNSNICSTPRHTDVPSSTKLDHRRETLSLQTLDLSNSAGPCTKSTLERETLPLQAFDLSCSDSVGECDSTIPYDDLNSVQIQDEQDFSQIFSEYSTFIDPNDLTFEPGSDNTDDESTDTDSSCTH